MLTLTSSKLTSEANGIGAISDFRSGRHWSNLGSCNEQASLRTCGNGRAMDEIPTTIADSTSLSILLNLQLLFRISGLQVSFDGKLHQSQSP